MSKAVPQRERIYCGLLLAGLVVICALVLAHPRHNASSEAGDKAGNEYSLPSGWALTGKWEHYPNGRIYEKIDGRETLFQGYGVVAMDFAAVRHQGHDFDVYIYRMSDADGAFGIFLAQVPSDFKEMDLGAMADVSGGQVRVLQGKTYIEIQPQEKSVPVTMTTALARGLLAGVKDERGAAGGATDRLPNGGRVPGTLAFNKDNAFGLKSLHDSYSASYNDRGTEFDYLIRKIPPNDGINVLSQVRDEVKEFDGTVTEFKPNKLSAQILGKRLLLIQEGGWLSGIYAESGNPEALYAKLKTKSNGRK